MFRVVIIFNYIQMKFSLEKKFFDGCEDIALECAGFLHGLGIDTTVMVRSRCLKSFDQVITGENVTSICFLFNAVCVRSLESKEQL
jgi:pyruvate/2-oxoglutarate dehydrogenase complex dihydrolipoamide dehydrogenase (E3) component